MFFFALSITFYLLQNFSNKHFSNTVKKSSTAITLVQNGICVLFSALSMVAINGIKVMPPKLILLSFLFGVFYLLTVFLLLKAFSLGSMGNSTLLCNIGMFISAFYGIIRFKDEFTVYIAIGTFLLLCAVILSVPRHEKGKKGGVKWFVIALLSGISNGVVASVKREAIAIYSDGVKNFLVFGFLFAFATAFTVLIVKRTNRQEALPILKKPVLVLCGVCAGIATAGANFFQMLSLKTVSSAIIYPFTSGFLTVSLWAASLLIYKETTLKFKNILAVIFCVIAIILVNIK